MFKIRAVASLVAFATRIAATNDAEIPLACDACDPSKSFRHPRSNATFVCLSSDTVTVIDALEYQRDGVVCHTRDNVLPPCACPAWTRAPSGNVLCPECYGERAGASESAIRVKDFVRNSSYPCLSNPPYDDWRMGWCPTCNVRRMSGVRCMADGSTVACECATNEEKILARKNPEAPTCEYCYWHENSRNGKKFMKAKSPGVAKTWANPVYCHARSVWSTYPDPMVQKELLDAPYNYHRELVLYRPGGTGPRDHLFACAYLNNRTSSNSPFADDAETIMLERREEFRIFCVCLTEENRWIVSRDDGL